MNASAQLPFQPHLDNAGAIRAFALAAVMHCLLFAFLYFGISWQNSPPEIPIAELWGEIPGAPEPPKPAPAVRPAPLPTPKVEEPKEPDPPPVKPAIVIKDPPKKPEVKKPEPVKKVEPPKKIEKELPRVDPLKSQLDKELNALKASNPSAEAGKELAQRGNPNGAAQAAWIDQIRARIKSNFALAQDVGGNPRVEFNVKLFPNGEIRSLTRTKASGNTGFDNAVENAIRNSQPFPRAPDSMSERDRLELNIGLPYADLKK